MTTDVTAGQAVDGVDLVVAARTQVACVGRAVHRGDAGCFLRAHFTGARHDWVGRDREEGLGKQGKMKEGIKNKAETNKLKIRKKDKRKSQSRRKRGRKEGMLQEMQEMQEMEEMEEMEEMRKNEKNEKKKRG